MSELLTISEAIAREAHAGQFYNDGKDDYVDFHIIPVVRTIIKLGYGEKYQAVGWTHDAGEDGGVSAEMMLERGLPLDVAVASELLRKKGEPHQTYLTKISENGLAVVAKVADSSVNLASTIMRASEIDDQRFKSWFRVYNANLAFLMPFMPPKEKRKIPKS